MGEVQEFTISHTGSVLDDGNNEVVREANTADSPDAILSFTCPRKFEEVRYRGQRDATRFVPRTKQTITGTTNDDTVVALNNDIRPYAGEKDIADQEEPVVVAYNVDQATEVEIASIDYAANEITLATDPADTETVKIWSIISQGTIQYQGRNALDQVEGPVYPWPTRVQVFSIFPQNKRGREIHQHGSVTWGRHETVEVLFEAPHVIDWTDADYPRGEYPSTFEQDVKIEL